MDLDTDIEDLYNDRTQQVLSKNIGKTNFIS